MILHHRDAADRPDGIALWSQTLPVRSRKAIVQVWLKLRGIGAALSFGSLIFAIRQAFGKPAWCIRQAQVMIAGTSAAAVSVGWSASGSGRSGFSAASSSRLPSLCLAPRGALLPRAE